MSISEDRRLKNWLSKARAHATTNPSAITPASASSSRVGSEAQFPARLRPAACDEMTENAVEARNWE